MKVIKIYCENGAFTKDVKSLKKDSDIELIYFPFENKTTKAKKSVMPSNLTVDSTFMTCDDVAIKISDAYGSDKYELISQVIGKDNIFDIKHVDTAYKEQCKIFISPDKGDIISKSDALEKLTGIKFFYCEDFKLIIKEIEKLRKMD